MHQSVLVDNEIAGTVCVSQTSQNMHTSKAGGCISKSAVHTSLQGEGVSLRKLGWCRCGLNKSAAHLRAGSSFAGAALPAVLLPAAADLLPSGN